MSVSVMDVMFGPSCQRASDFLGQAEEPKKAATGQVGSGL